jgi:hypothetical protein
MTPDSRPPIYALSFVWNNGGSDDNIFGDTFVAPSLAAAFVFGVVLGKVLEDELGRVYETGVTVVDFDTTPEAPGSVMASFLEKGDGNDSGMAALESLVGRLEAADGVGREAYVLSWITADGCLVERTAALTAAEAKAAQDALDGLDPRGSDLRDLQVYRPIHEPRSMTEVLDDVLAAIDVNDEPVSRLRAAVTALEEDRTQDALVSVEQAVETVTPTP